MTHIKMTATVKAVEIEGIRKMEARDGKPAREWLEAKAYVELEGGKMLCIAPGFNCPNAKFEALKKGDKVEIKLALDDVVRVDL